MQRGHSLFQMKKQTLPFFWLRPMRSRPTDRATTRFQPHGLRRFLNPSVPTKGATPSYTAALTLQLRFGVRLLNRHQPVVTPWHRTRIQERKLRRLRPIPQA